MSILGKADDNQSEVECGVTLRVWIKLTRSICFIRPYFLEFPNHGLTAPGMAFSFKGRKNSTIADIHAIFLIISRKFPAIAIFWQSK